MKMLTMILVGLVITLYLQLRKFKKMILEMMSNTEELEALLKSERLNK